MHGMSIAQSLIDIITEEMQANDAARLLAVLVHLGAMTVVADSLQFCFEILTADTKMAGAHLIMDIVPVTGRCGACGRDFEVEGYAFGCSFCKSDRVETFGGRDLSIVEMEVE